MRYPNPQKTKHMPYQYHRLTRGRHRRRDMVYMPLNNPPMPGLKTPTPGENIAFLAVVSVVLSGCVILGYFAALV